MKLKQELLQILCCPACADRPPLREWEGSLLCEQCQRVYPVRDGIPVLIVEEAVPLAQIKAGGESPSATESNTNSL